MIPAAPHSSAHLSAHPIAPADSVPADSVVADSVAPARFGLILSPENTTDYSALTTHPSIPNRGPNEVRTAPPGPSSPSSWVMLGIFLLFALVCLRIRSNKRYLKVLWRDLTEVRERHNAFDDTVKETSLLVLLNIFWSCCAGVLLYYLLTVAVPEIAEFSFALPVLHDSPGKAILLCIGMATLYTAFMTLAYTLIGNIFSDSHHTGMWVKGFAAQQGLSTLFLFPLALIALCYPSNSEIILFITLFPFIIGKIIFICKGFRIFFNNLTSCILFLYYLCSLEIVPLILTFVFSVGLCSIL